MLYCIPTKKKEKNTLHGVAVAGVQVAIAGIQAVAGILARTVGQPGQVAAGIRPIKRRLNGGGGVGGIGSQWLNSGGIGPIGSQWLNSSSRIGGKCSGGGTVGSGSIRPGGVGRKRLKSGIGRQGGKVTESRR